MAENIAIPEALQRLVTTYLNHLMIERGLSDNTLAAYRRDLQRYLHYLAQERVDDVTTITATILRVLQALSSGSHNMGSSPKAPSTGFIAARGWHRFMFWKIRLNQSGCRSSGSQTGQQLLTLSASTKSPGYWMLADRRRPGLRDRAMMELHATGARITEELILTLMTLHPTTMTPPLFGYSVKAQKSVSCRWVIRATSY